MGANRRRHYDANAIRSDHTGLSATMQTGNRNFNAPIATPPIQKGIRPDEYRQTMSRSYILSSEARRQRSEAAKARWAALTKPERTEALRPAYSIAGWPKGKPRRKAKPMLRTLARDVRGRFVKVFS